MPNRPVRIVCEPVFEAAAWKRFRKFALERVLPLKAKEPSRNNYCKSLLTQTCKVLKTLQV